MADKRCKDCPKDSKRPAPYPGPRCFTHNREATRAGKRRNAERRDAKVYGLQPGGYDMLLELQDGHCAICRRATGKTRRLSVDHDHKTGKVRGLLCRPCNTLLGHLRDDPVAAERIRDYLIDPPAGRLDPKYLEDR